MSYWLISLFLIQLWLNRISCDVVRYIPVETQPTATLSCFTPLPEKKVHFGLEYVRQGGSFFICPRIIFSSKQEATEGNKNLQLYFCLNHFGVTLNNAAEVLQEQEGVTVAENKFRYLWFELNSNNSTIYFGHQHSPVPILVYNFAAHFNKSFITSFGFAGSGRWLLESETPYLEADTRDVGRSTTYFPVYSKRIHFTVQVNVNFTWCPRIILSNKVDSYTDFLNLGVIICPSSIALISQGQNMTVIDRQNSLVFGSLKPYWLHIDQDGGIISLGDYGTRKPIFEYEFSDHFDDFFIEYFALAGSGHWIVQFLSDLESFKENLGLASYLSMKSNSTVTL